MGSFAEGIKGGAFSYLLLFYYNQVLGLPGSLAGAALAIAVVFDAVTDPLVGSLSDSTRSRFGRRHPYMYGAAIPFGLVFYAIFVPPEGLDETGLFLWLTVTSTLARGVLTLYAVPHMSLSAELTNDYHERTALVAVRWFFSLAGAISVLIVGFAFYFQAGGGFEDGRFNSAAYQPFARTAGIAMAISILMSALGTHHTIPKLPKAAANPEHTVATRLLREVRQALSLRPFRFLLGAMVANYTIQGVLVALSVYMLTFFWKLDPGGIQTLLVVGMGSMVLGSMVATPIARRVTEKRTLAMIGMGWFAFFGAIMVILRLLGLAPEDGHWLLLPLIIGGSLLSGVGGGVTGVLKSSMIADVTDEYERVFGIRQEGIFYSAVSFGAKATTGAGTALAGLAIDWIGLVPGSDPATVPDSVIEGLGFVYGPFMLLLTLLPIALISFYDIDHERHQAIRRELEARKDEAH